MRRLYLTMKRYSFLLLALSLIANLVLGGFLFYNQTSIIPEVVAITDVKAAGVYGPSGLEVIEGDFTIDSADVTLQNTLVSGNLYLSAGIGEGSVALNNVVVEGTALVQGGGQNTVVFENATINHLQINKEDGKVRVVLKGDTRVEKVILEGESYFDATELSEEGYVKEVYIQTAKEVEIAGLFTNVIVAEKDAQVKFLAGKADKLSTTNEALVNLAGQVEIEILEPGAPLELTGEGVVKKILVASPGLVKVAGSIEDLVVSGRGIFIELAGGTVEKLLVEASEGTVMIHLAQGTKVGYMELNGPTDVTGQGEIKETLINIVGITIEQTPVKVQLAKNITANVGGKELPLKVEEKPTEPTKPSQPSQPSTPTVTLDSISNMSSLGVTRTGTRDLSVSPKDANVTASSSDNKVASVSLSGNKLTVTGNAVGTATITVTAKKSGYNDRTRTFKVTVTAVKSVLVKDGLSPGYKTVIVDLYYPNQGNYTVTVGGHKLDYNSSLDRFYSEVPEKDAQGTVRVTK
jgi:hypothetical protein